MVVEMFGGKRENYQIKDSCQLIPVFDEYRVCVCRSPEKAGHNREAAKGYVFAVRMKKDYGKFGPKVARASLCKSQVKQNK